MSYALSLEEKISWFNNKRTELIIQSRANGGKIIRSDLWRKDYYTNPYLARAKDDDLFNRLCDVFHNQVDLDDQGRICPSPMMHNDAWILQRWAHLVEELSTRGGFTGEMLNAANEPLHKYFARGIPPGVVLFRGGTPLKSKALVKYSKRDFIEKMHRTGEIRLAPASYYASGSLLNAQQDLEVQRQFTIPTGIFFNKGYSHMNVEGKTYNIAQGDITINERIEDYFLYCMCREIDRRLPTDFEADAALVIHDPSKFQRLFFDALREKLRGWDMRNGEVKYYDPYTDYKRHNILEMTKHFKYYYQKEFRLVARPKAANAINLEPFFLRLGSLEDISTPYFLPD
jgi:hypothetical protein